MPVCDGEWTYLFADGTLGTACVEDVLMAIVPCVFIGLAGSVHLNHLCHYSGRPGGLGALHTCREGQIQEAFRRQTRAPLDKWMIALSALVAVLPFIFLLPRWQYSSIEDPDDHETWFAVCHLLSWSFATLILIVQSSPSRALPHGWSLRYFWFLVLGFSTIRMRSILRSLVNSDWDSRSVEFDTLTFVVIYVCILIVSFLGICFNTGLRPKPLDPDLASLSSSAVGSSSSATTASQSSTAAFLDSSSSSPFLAAGAPAGSPEPIAFDKLAKRPIASSAATSSNGYSAVSDGNGHTHLDDNKSIDTDASTILDNCLACDALKQSPELYSSLFVRLTFGWLNPLMSAGNHHQLRQDELLNLNKDDNPHAIDEKFTRLWREELEKPNPSLVRALYRTFGWYYVSAVLVKTIYDAAMFINPQMLNYIAHYLMPDNKEPWYNGYYYAGGMFIGAFSMSLLQHQCFQIFQRVGMRMRAAITTAVYRKTLVLSSAARQSRSSGEIVTLTAVDAGKLQGLFMFLHMLWSGPLQITLAIVFLFQQLGASTFAGLAVMLCMMIPLNATLARRAKKIQAALMTRKDLRIKLTNECLQSIKILKLYAWEKSFGKKIEEVRDSELYLLRRYLTMSLVMSVLWRTVPVIVALTTFSVYTLTDHELTAANAFTSLALFDILQFPVSMFPQVITNVIDARVSLNRVKAFLMAEEVDTKPIEVRHGGSIEVSRGTFYWDDDRQVTALTDVNMSIPAGKLCCVVGETGAGKSALLNALIGELRGDDALSMTVAGTVAYTAQTPWIRNATLRDNILFGKPYEGAWYNKVIEACALSPDFAVLPAGDKTEIGAKGINLSGGQKQRVALARAVYQDAEIYLLDDALSAVDAHVGLHIINHCIMGLLATKTRVLVTHNLHILPLADTVGVIERGRLKAFGAYASLVADGLDFTKIIPDEKMETKKPAKKAENKAPAKKKDNWDPKELAAQLLKDHHPLKKSFSFRYQSAFGEDMSIRGERVLADLLGHADNFDGDSPPLPLSRDPTATSSTSLLTGTSSNGNGHTGGKTERTGLLAGSRQSAGLSTSDSHDDGLSGIAVVDTMPHASGTNGLKEDVKSPAKKSVAGRLVADEERVQGKVSWQVYRAYITAAGGTWVAVIVILTMALMTVSNLATNTWLSFWADEDQTAEGRDEVGKWLGIYALFCMMAILMLIIALITMLTGAFKAARRMHETLLRSMLRVPMSIYDTTPIGRILNRFTKEQYSVDEVLQASAWGYLSILSRVVGVALIISVVTPYFLLVLAPIGVVYGFTQRYYVRSSRELQRWESVLRSPILSHFTETLEGSISIRAFGMQHKFLRENEDKLTNNLRAYYPSLTASRWLGVRLDIFGNFAVIFASCLVVYQRGTLEAGLGSLAISYALSITNTLSMLVRVSSDWETNIVSVERIREYTELPHEAPLVVAANRPPPEWPSQGRIRFRNLQLRYRTELDLVLKGLNCTIEPREKIGIVGRTGAGKSSMLLALLRLVEPAAGTIEIDGIDFRRIGLHDLRSRMSIIPQDPVLFTGTIRFNLDPFDERTDDDVWRALEHAHLISHIRSLPKGLDADVAEGGSNFSMGQRQLLCLARALLRKSKILLLDEATSAIDHETDQLVQNTIATAFADCTTLTIAHRLETIMNSTRVMVLARGQIVEMDSPIELLKQPGGHFSQIIAAANIASSASSSDVSKDDVASPASATDKENKAAH